MKELAEFTKDEYAAYAAYVAAHPLARRAPLTINITAPYNGRVDVQIITVPAS